MIPANDSVRLLDEIVEEMDLSPLHRAYKRTGRRSATKPATMPKILLYANMEHIYSSRKIQSACQRDINFIWLLDGAPAPSHNEIARFCSIRLAERAVEARLQPTIRGRRQYITGISISSERSDQLCLIPLLEKIEQHSIPQYMDVTADAGYESEENHTYFEKKATQCYIKPQNYEKSKTKKYKNNMALRENMAYDSEKDEYTCQNGKKLKAVYTGKRESRSGFESEITYYECENCEGCPHKKQCTRAKGNRKMQVSKKFIEQREQSRKRIISEQGILLRMNRSIQSEGAFGVVKEDYGFRRYLLRGNRKVLAETILIAMAYNLNKYHAKIQ